MRAPAAYAMGCPADQLKLTILTMDSVLPLFVTSVGVEGCGKRVIYVNVPNTATWVLNADSEQVQ